MANAINMVLFAIIPLLVASLAKKISILVALDLSVWLVAASTLFYFMRTPWDLWYTVKNAAEELEMRQSNGEDIKSLASDLRAKEFRMFCTAWVTPFIAIFGWHLIAQYLTRYNMNSMAELVHPYVIVVICLVGGGYPVQQSYIKTKHMLFFSPSDDGVSQKKKDDTRKIGIAAAKREVNLELSQLHSHLQTNDDQVRRLEKRIDEEFQQCLNTRTRLEQDLKILRKEVKARSSKKLDDMQQFERRIINSENQIELMHLMLSENADKQKGILSGLIPPSLHRIYGN
eukprot:TRINITY_DN1573_c0_g1_i3.p1 TRINITY_DN1573_c0_g1~~TRINITY_DN1573_c0_g1_i3.p1  ORF type:complete len:286 (+),score=59.19 TRINITY_DN1573_c0_g1_i3:151-1008(+)